MKKQDAMRAMVALLVGALVLAAGHVVPPATGLERSAAAAVKNRQSRGGLLDNKQFAGSFHDVVSTYPPITDVVDQDQLPLADVDNDQDQLQLTDVACGNHQSTRGGGLLDDQPIRDDQPLTDVLNKYQDQPLPGGNADIKVAAVVKDSLELPESTFKTYLSFLADFDFHVNATRVRHIKQHPVLAPQRLYQAPQTFFNISISGEGDDRVDILIRSDNLYIVAFSNKQKKIFALKPQEGQYQMPGATVLELGGGYGDLFGKKTGFRGLDNVQVSRLEALEHLKVLANYQKGGDERGLKVPVAFFALVVCEAARFPQIREAVAARWDQSNASPIQPHLVGLVVKWRIFSCAILSWDRGGQTADAWTRNNDAKNLRESFGVVSADDALTRVTPILQPSRIKCPSAY